MHAISASINHLAGLVLGLHMLPIVKARQVTVERKGDQWLVTGSREVLEALLADLEVHAYQKTCPSKEARECRQASKAIAKAVKQGRTGTPEARFAHSHRHSGFLEGDPLQEGIWKVEHGSAAAEPLLELLPSPQSTECQILTKGDWELPSSALDPYVIIAIAGMDPLKMWSLRSPLAIIGRSSSASLRIDDGSLSRAHCAIELVDGEHLLRDLGSRNGTRLNGELIEAHPLKHGDELEVGQVRLVYAANDRAVDLIRSYLPE